MFLLIQGLKDVFLGLIGAITALAVWQSPPNSVVKRI